LGNYDTRPTTPSDTTRSMAYVHVLLNIMNTFWLEGPGSMYPLAHWSHSLLAYDIRIEGRL